MKIDILTLFPEMFAPLSASILGRAQKENKLQINVVNIRSYTEDKHGKCDDYPFGGGAGMVMTAQPIGSAIEALDPEHKAHRIYLSPKGETFRQQKVFELLAYEHIILLCGHYEGVDQRVLDEIVDEEISLGDYVLTGGELGALVIADAVGRLCPGVLSEEVCFTEESHYSGLLEYPQYTRPPVWHGMQVPAVLSSGHHANIQKWQREQSLRVTAQKRPDLLHKAIGEGRLTKKELEWVQPLLDKEELF